MDPILAKSVDVPHPRLADSRGTGGVAQQLVDPERRAALVVPSSVSSDPGDVQAWVGI